MIDLSERSSPAALRRPGPQALRRKTRERLGALWILAVTLPWMVNCTSAPGYRGPRSDHFDGIRFQGHKPFDKSLWKVLRWKLFGDKVPWPEHSSEPSRKIPDDLISSQSDFACYVNHATVLLQISGLRILTDPIFSERSSPFQWVGPKRIRPPGIAFEDLPKIDFVLISHNHYDHLDLPSLLRLEARDAPTFLVGLGNAALLESHGVKSVRELDWGQRCELGGIDFHFVYCQHWSARGAGDRCQTLWGSWIMKARSGRSIYFAGDTGYSDHLREQGLELGPFDLALLPIGAYEPRWFMRYQHMNPADSTQAHLDLRARRSMAIHFGTFPLADEAIDAPAKDLAEARRQLGLSEKDFFVPDFGGCYKID
jgi:L-ascorbate metabolism protein UlaG (beta-lactamase superfamily)